MTITFNELRRIKDQLPSGSTQRIADELGVDVEIVRNYFGGRHFESGNTVGVHFEPGPDGGVVTLDDTAILDCAKRILDERQANCRGRVLKKILSVPDEHRLAGLSGRAAPFRFSLPPGSLFPLPDANSG